MPISDVCSTIAKSCGLFAEVDDGADYDALEKTFGELLAEFSKQSSSKLLIVCEALNQLDSTAASRAHELTWVPSVLPKNVKMILSTLPASTPAKVLESRKTPQAAVGALTEHDRSEIVTEMLAKYNKRLDDNQMRLLLTKSDAQKPLFLAAACEDLRVFGVFEKLSQKIKDMPSQLYSLIESIVRRVESELGALVAPFLSLLFLSKSGLLETELAEMLGTNSSQLSSLLLSLEIFTRRVGKEQSLDFAHRQFAKATSKMFFDSAANNGNGTALKSKHQRTLATYYLTKYQNTVATFHPSKGADPEPRAVSYLPHYLIVAGMSAEVEQLLTSIRYLRRRCHLGQVYELVADFQSASSAFSGVWSQQQAATVRKFASFIQTNVYLFASQPELVLQQAVNSSGALKLAGEAELKASQSAGIKENYIRWINNVRNSADGADADAVMLLAMDARTDVNDVCWSPNDGGQTLLSSHRDGSISLWNRRTGEELSRLAAQHADRINSVEFIRPSGHLFASAAADKALKIFDTQSRQLVATHSAPMGINCLDCIQFGSGTLLFVAGCDDGAIRVYSGSSPSNLTVSTLADAHVGGVSTVRLDYDSNFIYLVSGGVNKQIKLWKSSASSARAPTMMATFQLQFACSNTLASAHTKPVKEVKIFSFSGKRFVLSSSQDKTVKIWSFDNGGEVCTIDVHGDNVETCDVAIRNSKVLIVSGSWDRSVRVFTWDGASREATQVASLPSISHFINSVCFSPDNANAILVGSPDHTVRIFSTDAAIDYSRRRAAPASTGSQLLFQVHNKMIRGLAYDPKSQLLATGSWDNTACIMKVSGATGAVKLEKSKTVTGHTKRVNIVSWAASKQGSPQLVTSSMDYLVKTWNADSGAPLKTFKGHRSNVFVVATSHDGRYIASASSDNKIMIWNNDSSVKGSSKDEAIAVLDAHKDWATAIAFSPYSRRLVSAGRDGLIKVWNTETGEEIETLRGHEACVLQVCYSADGKIIASASEDRTVRLWDAFTLKSLAVMRGHTNELTSCAFLRGPNAHVLITGSSDKTIKFWDTRTHRCLWTYFTDSGVTSMDSTLDGNTVFVGESAGCVHVLDLSQMQWL